MSGYAQDKKFYIENIASHEKKIYMFLLGKVDDPTLAEDLVQNTMEKAWKNLSQLRDRDNARSWLFSIAENEAKLYYRKYKKIDKNVDYYDNNEDLERLISRQIEEEQADSLEILVHNFDIAVLKKALGRLEPKYRKLIVMHYYQGMSQKEIAALLCENYSTVRVNVTRALQRLRALAVEMEKEVR